ncbi:Tat (twin-arginine translocation) pathway signal sequence domain protein [Geminocystis sp. NIES-3708]|uniref:PhoX family protein n=1 Tax=Geminocystis sp. NIES-3708 TaxID=1615909 RepID=UPI0005FC635A|nr:alkaline phosphatase PhoX [Geminocystis sp. NIES-3708]BAQ62692.1 Tat (twin-arginine translocation) pathway signal sequence domain protein [Geminocystis sp. NIES-3708]
MTFKRREFLTFLGVGIAAIACSSILKSNLNAKTSGNVNHSFSNFKPIKYPIPLEINNLNSQQQKEIYQSYQVEDDLILPEGFKYDVIASWGDKVGDSRFGYNNDYVSFVEISPNEGFLVINFEYVSPIPWLQTYETVINKSLSQEVLNILTEANQNRQALNIFTLADDNPAKLKFQEFFAELLIDQGVGIISIKKDNDGKWQRTYSKNDRRITGISGWKDNRYLSATGAATNIFKKSQGLGYIDNLGNKIIGTFANCAGGTSPWGTVFSAEENFQNYVPEAIMADGTSFSPEFEPVSGLNGQGNPFGLAGNKYGWMVEIDPSNPDDYGTKHTWLGRFRHEAVTIRAEKDQPLVFYSGCDRTGGHLYKFVSKGKVINPIQKKNSKLLEEGMLYVAKMLDNGKGEWIALQPDTPINPTALKDLEGGLLTIPNPDRKKGGFIAVKNQQELEDFMTKYPKLENLYLGENKEEIQGVILIDAHYAANVVGGTCGARPEDVELNPIDNSLVIAYTAGVAGSEGSPDKRIFSDNQGKMYQYGCLMRLKETDNKPDAMTFTWDILVVGGEPSKGGMGFANPDNLEFDANGDLWMVTDMPTGIQNQLSQGKRNTIGALGNNSIWYIPLSGENAGKAYPFGIVPMEAEGTGLYFTKDQKTLFLAIQHPAEISGMRKDKSQKTTEISILTTEGEEFQQKRTIPQGSNWPDLQTNQPPKPSIVAIYNSKLG